MANGHKTSIRVFIFIFKFSTCCRNTNLDYTIKTISYRFTVKVNEMADFSEKIKTTFHLSPSTQRENIEDE
jgi:hypothetical protein